VPACKQVSVNRPNIRGGIVSSETSGSVAGLPVFGGQIDLLRGATTDRAERMMREPSAATGGIAKALRCSRPSSWAYSLTRARHVRRSVCCSTVEMGVAPLTAVEASPRGDRPPDARILVDYDNVVPGDLPSRLAMAQHVQRFAAPALEIDATIENVSVRLYGGWLEEGVLTARASALQTLIGTPAFALPHPKGQGVLRLSVVLVTRLVGVPDVEWGHTLRSSKGLPQLRLADSGHPHGCIGAQSCPVTQLRRISRGRKRKCPLDGCSVINEDAFMVREQKMVDALINCDTVSLAEAARVVVVISNDLDVLPGITLAAMANAGNCTLALARPAAPSVGLYDSVLDRSGVQLPKWELA
jgi:hypothetical protein